MSKRYSKGFISRQRLMDHIKKNPLKYVDYRIKNMDAHDIAALFRSLANTDGIGSSIDGTEGD